MEKGTLILIVCVIFGLGLFMVSKLGRFIKESRKAISDERSNLQLLKKVEMSSKGRKKNADMHVILGTVMPVRKLVRSRSLSSILKHHQ